MTLSRNHGICWIGPIAGGVIAAGIDRSLDLKRFELARETGAPESRKPAR